MITQKALRDTIDEALAERITDQEVYVAYGKTGFALEGANLLYLRDQYHQQFLDFTSGNATAPLGHSRDSTRSRIAEQLGHYGYVGKPEEWVQRWPVEYARTLSQSLPNSTEEPMQVLFTTDQDTAMSLASTMAQRVTDRTSLTTKVDDDWINWNDVAALIVRVVDQHGRLTNPQHVANAIRQARKAGALIIADERRTGFGITGKRWGQERWGYVADITVVGGPGGGGFPFGAVVAPEGYFEVAHDWLVRAAPAGHPAVCAAGLETLLGIDDPLLEHVVDAGAVLHTALAELALQFDHLIQDHSGVGLIHHLRFESYREAKTFHALCFPQGLIVGTPLGRTVELTPPLVTSELEIRRGVDLMSAALLEWKD